MNINFNKLYKQSSPYFVIFIFVYILNTLIFIVLPKTSIESSNKGINYFSKIDYSSIYKGLIVNKKPPVKEENKIEYEPITNIILKAIYSQNKSIGWIIVQDKNSDNRKILEVNDSFKGYKLIELYRSFVLFKKSSKEYKLEVFSNKSFKYSVINRDKKTEDKKIYISRSYLNSKVKNIDSLLKDIYIKEVKVQGDVIGFEILEIIPNSLFEKLGLEEKDIIKEFNNSIVTSYSEAISIYNNINSLNKIKLKILRNNELLELEYEID